MSGSSTATTVGCALVLVLVLASTVRADDPVVQTTYGPVKGTEDDGVNVFHSIPFAAPPIGDLRFAAPQAPAPWNTTKDVSGLPNICPQLHLLGSLFLGNEDCLYLHVYAPHTDGSQKLPVMFWIFGGGYVMGDGYEFGWYDGKHLAETRNVIVVAANYRVGAFGFLASEELQNENPNKYTGNQALLDQNLAMQWTKANIAAFGGDPDRIAIFGESAGGFSVCWHLVSPLSAGLFSGAIMESGSCDSRSFFMPKEQTFQFATDFADSVGCTSDKGDVLKCLRSASTADLMESNLTLSSAQTMTAFAKSLAELGIPAEMAAVMPPALTPVMPWGPTIDGTSLLELPLKSLRAGKFNKVPTIFGTNENEGRIFVPALPLIVPGTHFPPTPADVGQAFHHFFSFYTTNETAIDDAVNKTLTQYPSANYDGNEWYRASAVLTDWFFACGTRRSARAIEAAGVDIWLYQFTYKPDWIEVGLLGDYHTIELCFVWGNQWPPILHGFYKPESKELSDAMGHYWTNMAAVGHPNDQTTAFEWPKYNATADVSIDLSWPLTSVTGMRKTNCDFWDDMMQQFL